MSTAIRAADVTKHDPGKRWVRTEVRKFDLAAQANAWATVEIRHRAAVTTVVHRW